MLFKCRKVDDTFLENPPEVITNSVDLPMSAAEVFAILVDEQAWPRWFKTMKKVNWTSPKPYGVGTTRRITMQADIMDEYFYAWEPDRRFAFCFTRTSRPFANAFAEDYLLEPAEGGGCRFIWRVGYQLKWFLKPLGRFMRADFNALFGTAIADFSAYVDGVHRRRVRSG